MTDNSLHRRLCFVAQRARQLPRHLGMPSHVCKAFSASLFSSPSAAPSRVVPPSQSTPRTTILITLVFRGMYRPFLTFTPLAATSGHTARPMLLLRTTWTQVSSAAFAVAPPTTAAGLSFSSLRISRRYQRSTSSRPRSSTWEEKTQQFEARQREQQEEAARAARRRARYTSTASPSPSAFRSARGSDDDDAAASTTASASSSSSLLTRPSFGFWRFLKGGDRGRKSQPMNPLMHLSRSGGEARHDPEARATQRLLEAVNGLQRRNTRRGRDDRMMVQITEDQKQEIVNRYAATRWYASLYRPFRGVTENQIRWSLRLSHFLIIALLCGFIVLAMTAYYREMEAVAKLSPEDQRDYAYMVQGMRYSDIFNTGKAVLDREDPLEALPPEVRLHMVIDACREKQYHKLDWDVELRQMHPKSAWEEWDYMHMLYWVIMEMGHASSGGGGLFNDRVMEYEESRQGNAEPRAVRERFVEEEPTALPTNTKRGFFS